MSTTPADVSLNFSTDAPADWVSHLWDNYNQKRREWLNEKLELRNYLFATDTSSTSNNDLPWKNKTTIPKLCQIRDNLHSNYLSALMPNDRWLTWVAFDQDAAAKEKASLIKAYMSNKAREGGLRTKLSELVLDYIDYGMAVSTATFESRHRELPDGTQVAAYVGPKAERISPQDIVFNPRARSFEESFKIIRTVKSLGEIKAMAEDQPDNRFWLEVFEKRMALREHAGSIGSDDFNKAMAYEIDGFGSYYDYIMSEYVEILEFYGDYEDFDNRLHRNIQITIADRTHVVGIRKIPSWLGGDGLFQFVGWRSRPDNLYPMGPLDNLVGLQYRIDHLENAKADAFDMAIHPPLAVSGNVQDFKWGPDAVIYMDEGGSVQELGKSLNAIVTADNQIAMLEQIMEEMAGAPKQAMGIRTPGEKTATEVMQLQTAAGRIFQEKVTHFEVSLLEPLLNSMWEQAARHLGESGSDTVAIVNEQGVQVFETITREDITAYGKLRPIGARHFSKQSQDLQNILGVANSAIWPKIEPHTSGAELSKFINDVVGLSGYNIFSEGVGVKEAGNLERKRLSEEESVIAERNVDVEGLLGE